MGLDSLCQILMYHPDAKSMWVGVIWAPFMLRGNLILSVQYFWALNIDHAQLQEYANWFLAEPRPLYIYDFSTCIDAVQ